MNELEEIDRIAVLMQAYCPYYHAREDECPAEFKLLMLVNGWTSPFIALTEMLRIIEADEKHLKQKKIKVKNKSRELAALLRQTANNIYND